MSINHLNIEQATSSIEVVSPSVIDKLYELAQNPSLDSGSNVQGNLQVVHAYEDAVSYLLNKFPNLQINVTGGAYIRFADPLVNSMIANKFGDGTGTTLSRIQSITSLDKLFSSTSITSFDEFKYFTNIIKIIGGSYDNGDFVNCTSLQSITIPDSIKYIESGSFYNCKNLKTINLSNVESIGNYAFSNCLNLSIELNLPKLTGYFRGFSYSGITKVVNLGYITIMNSSDSSHELSDACLAQCQNLTEVNVPDTCTQIGGMSNCPKLTTVNFNNNVTIIRERTFYNDTSLITIGDVSKVTVIGDQSFIGTTFTSLSFPSCTTLIGPYLSNQFNNCKKLTTISFNDNFTGISNGAFNGCSSLISISTLSHVITIGSSAFYNCSSLKTVDLNSACTTIGDESFRDCSSLESIGDINSVTTIGYRVFHNCKVLKTIELTNITSIGNGAFNTCPSLKYLKINASSVPTVGSDILYGSDICKIYVTDSLVDSYKSATNWSAYASRIFSLTQFAIDFPNG